MTTGDAPAVPFKIPSVVTEIGARARLKGINLVRTQCELTGALRPGEQIPEVKFETRGGATRPAEAPGTLICAFGLEVIGLGPKPDLVRVARFSCDYAIQYEFDAPFLQAQADKDLSLFAAYNASLHAWPHVREFIQSMAFRMTLPPIVLPIMRTLDMVGPPENWKKLTPKAT
jgi:hypothetical protein